MILNNWVSGYLQLPHVNGFHSLMQLSEVRLMTGGLLLEKPEVEAKILVYAVALLHY